VSVNSTQGGRVFRGLKDDLWYFDQLPPPAREALANARFNWASGAVFNAWKRRKSGFETAKEIDGRHISQR
jgi:Family of unknown function (DUF6525)